MGTFIKICGICSRTDLEQICALGPDAIGFVFYPRSKRYVRPAQVANWLPSIPEAIKKVGVFFEPTAEEIESIARTCELDIVQIHIESNAWRIDRPLFPGLDVWLSPRMSEELFPLTDWIAELAPSVLLADSFDSKTIGGTGRLSDWNRAIAVREMFQKPIVLAGGLRASNVAEGIEAVQPWGVDVSSGVEKEPGVKDLRQVKKFITAVRHCS